MSKVAPIPAQYGRITPYLVISGCAAAIDAYKKVFGAEEVMRMPTPEGKVAHAELRFGDRMLMLADGNERYPQTDTMIMLYVEDCDAVFARAQQAGWKVIDPLEDKFYGDRTGLVMDPFGQRWSIGTHKEEVSPEEMQKRMEKLTQ